MPQNVTSNGHRVTHPQAEPTVEMPTQRDAAPAPLLDARRSDGDIGLRFSFFSRLLRVCVLLEAAVTAIERCSELPARRRAELGERLLHAEEALADHIGRLDADLHGHLTELLTSQRALFAVLDAADADQRRSAKDAFASLGLEARLLYAGARREGQDALASTAADAASTAERIVTLLTARSQPDKRGARQRPA